MHPLISQLEVASHERPDQPDYLPRNAINLRSRHPT